MTGFALILHRDGAPVPNGVVERLAHSLVPEHRRSAGARAERLSGPGWELVCAPGTGRCSDGPIHLVLDGRLDNRQEVAQEIGGALGDTASPTTDAALLLAAYARWGEGCFEHLLGPCAAVILDAGRRRIVCGRDALGDRSLIYRLSAGRLLVATHEEVLLEHPEVSRDVDEGTVARFFALEAAAPGRTFFADLRELGPGTAMALAMEPSAGGIPRFWRHWELPAGDGGGPWRDRDAAERFRELLDAAVRARLPANGEAPAAVLMSGGLDSTAVAACAAAGSGGPLHTLSWVFDELPRADEREFMEPTVRALGAEPSWILGDDAWPLAGCLEHPERHLGVGSPYAAVYRRLRDRAYRQVAARGGQVLLTGECGDQLFVGAEGWLRDLLAGGRPVTAGLEVVRALAGAGRDDRIGLRTSVASVLRSPAPRRHDPRAACPWLTEEALERLGDGPPPAGGAASLDPSVRRPEQAAAVLDPRIAAAVRQESRRAADAGIEIRRPYRDRRLIELALAVPAHQLYRPGRTKWLTREALRGALPETVRRRRRRSSLFPLFRRGVEQYERPTVDALLDSPRAWWPRYVRSSWLRGFYPDRITAEADGAGALVLWQCLAFELWRRRVERSSDGLDRSVSHCSVAG